MNFSFSINSKNYVIYAKDYITIRDEMTLNNLKTENERILETLKLLVKMIQTPDTSEEMDLLDLPSDVAGNFLTAWAENKKKVINSELIVSQKQE